MDSPLMEPQSFFHFQNVLTMVFFFFFSFTIFFSLFHVLLLYLRHKIWCDCQICSSYCRSSWASDFNNLSDWFTHLLKNSPTQTIHVHTLGNIITSNPEVVEYILKTKFNNYPKGKPFSMLLGDLLGKGIFNSDGDLWLFQRKMASLELGSISIRSYAFETVIKEIKLRLLPLLTTISEKKNGVLELQDVFQRFSFDNICNFSFGLDPGCLESCLPMSQFAESFALATKLSAERALATSPLIWKIKRFLNIGSERKLKEAIEVVKILAHDVIRQKRKLGYSNHHDLLSRFMACVNDDNILRDIVVSFILAGRDTMASALTALFWLIASHQDVMSKIQTEADGLMGKGEEGVSFHQIRKMHYLHATVYECLRLYPPIQFDSKFALEDDVLPDGTFVRKGKRVTYHPYAMARMENLWGPDCNEFKPERWLDGDGNFCPQNPFKCPIFQAGNRVCLGKEMAIVEMKIVALLVFRKFDLEVVAPTTAPRFETGLTATLRGGLLVAVKKKQSGTAYQSS